MSNKMDKILAEISAGELIDKITILEIKKIKILDNNKLIEVNKELNSLNETRVKLLGAIDVLEQIEESKVKPEVVETKKK